MDEAAAAAALPDGTVEEAAEAAARALLTPGAVRERAGALFAQIEDGRSDHFCFEPAALPRIADQVAELTRTRYPDAIPIHSRWRHFEAGGIDRFGALAAARGWPSPRDAARAMGDLAIVSVLLDAGAGPTWRYREAATGEVVGRSVGLALASLGMFVAGSFSAVPADPLRADRAALETLSQDEFDAGFQVGPANPLEGAAGRLALLEALAERLRERPDLFASEDDPRPGGLIDALAAEADAGRLPAGRILERVLEALNPIWPSRLSLADIPLGDTWRHPALGDGAPGSGLVPFHKLSTWLSLSLVEPLEVAGIEVMELDALPGLAEYRNGGLFVDGGALSLTASLADPLPVDHPLIVEWRAATVVLLDRLLPLMRERLGDELTLGAMLEGGTWATGRALAEARDPEARPPIAIVSDGTVF